jgi:pimeloyl-ACP methyl ester carboxylesterase
MDADRFRIPAGDGSLVGEREGEGPPALVLHGGPAVPDYTEGLAAELADCFTTIRYTQRGVVPSTVEGPYTIESHMADALSVLDHFGLDQAWLVGHSWGGHLALHLAVAHPQRLLGIVAVDPLGAFAVFDEAGENLRRNLSRQERARVDEVENRRRRGEATDEDLADRFAILWPQYFADPASALHIPPRIGRDCSRETNASIMEHFQRGTLERGLPDVRLPMLFVHGALDPVPQPSVERTAALVPGACFESIATSGHFPWWETPGEIRRIVGEFLAERA